MLIAGLFIMTNHVNIPQKPASLRIKASIVSTLVLQQPGNLATQQ